MKFIDKPIEIIKQNWKAYLVANTASYGLVIFGMVIAFFNPQLQENVLSSAEQDLSPDGPLSLVATAYSSGNILSASAFTFIVNLIVGSFLTQTLPSFIIPFSGILMAIYRSIYWGFMFAPIVPETTVSIIPHYLTLLIEGQGYIIAAFAIYLHGKSFLFPKSIGQETRWGGYKHGIIQTAWLYVLVAIVLLIGAIYEAIEIILLIPLFS